MVQALYALLSLKLTLRAYQTEMTFMYTWHISFFPEVSASKHGNKTTSKASHKQMQRMNDMSFFASELFPSIF
jgi:hypothetical protein